MIGKVLALYRRAYAGLPIEIWMLSLALFVNRCGTMVLPFLTIYLTNHLGFTKLSATLILSVYGVGSLAGAYVAGRLISSVGAVRLQFILLLLSVPAFLLVPFFSSWWGIAIAVFVLSFFSEGVRPANSTAIAQFSPEPVQTRAFGLQRMALNLGISFGPAIGGFLTMISFVWLFVADAATTLVCAILLISFFGIHGTKQQERNGNSPPPKTETSPGQNVSPLTDPMFVCFLLLTLLTAVVFFQFHATYPLYLNEHYNMSEWMIGLIYSVNTIVIVVFEMVLLEYIRKLSMMKVIAWGALLSCIGFGILPLSASIWFCVLSMLILTIGEMLQMPVSSGWIAQRSKRGNQGMYMSYYTMTWSLAAIIAPALGGAIYQYNIHMFWYLSLAIGILSFMGFVWLARVLQRERPTSEIGQAENQAGIHSA